MVEFSNKAPVDEVGVDDDFVLVVVKFQVGQVKRPAERGCFNDPPHRVKWFRSKNCARKFTEQYECTAPDASRAY